jgi:hypothetical protein
MITQRRVFQAKVGAAGQVVAKMKEFQPLFSKYGGPKARIYTDFNSGSTDRVVWEADFRTMARLEKVFTQVQRDPEAQKAFAKWFTGLAPIIEGATVEIWQREA